MFHNRNGHLPAYFDSRTSLRRENSGSLESLPKDREGQDRPRQGRAGQGRAGQGRAGKARAIAEFD